MKTSAEKVKTGITGERRKMSVDISTRTEWTVEQIQSSYENFYWLKVSMVTVELFLFVLLLHEKQRGKKVWGQKRKEPDGESDGQEVTQSRCPAIKNYHNEWDNQQTSQCVKSLAEKEMMSLIFISYVKRNTERVWCFTRGDYLCVWFVFQSEMTGNWTFEGKRSSMGWQNLKKSNNKEIFLSAHLFVFSSVLLLRSFSFQVAPGWQFYSSVLSRRSTPVLLVLLKNRCIEL